MALKPCGTYAAAQRHKLNGEPLCEPCVEARREYNREWDRTRNRRKAAVPLRHATNSMYVNGCRCEDCKWAHRVYQAEWRAGKKPWRKRSRTIEDSVRDVLVTYYPERLSTVLVVLRVVEIHPNWNPDSVKRVLSRSQFDSELVDGERVWWCEEWD